MKSWTRWFSVLKFWICNYTQIKGFGRKKEIKAQIEEPDRRIEIRGRQRWREPCMYEAMTIFDKTTAPSCGFSEITQSSHYIAIIPTTTTTHTWPRPDEIKPRARCDLWNTGPHLCKQGEEFRERFIPPLSCLGADGAHWGCWEDCNALKCKRTIKIDQSFCFDSLKIPKGRQLSTVAYPLPAQLLGFSQTFNPWWELDQGCKWPEATWQSSFPLAQRS